jgi:5-oxoprolinase (ATP-hydrolysing)
MLTNQAIAHHNMVNLSDRKADPILLTLFANRFMSVAEAMGRSLQQTSISTNIKERLDFSCALFAPDGDLVANAPFIPIHLGAMSLYDSFSSPFHRLNVMNPVL